MEEKKLTGEESLELIARMIQSTKRNMEVGRGNRFLIYGYTAVGLSVAIYLLVRFTGSYAWNMAWFLMFIPAVITGIVGRRKRTAAVTYTDKILNGIWQLVLGLFILTVIAIAVISLALFGGIAFSLMFPLSLLYVGIGTAVTGIIVREPYLVYMPAVGFVIAIYMVLSYTFGSGPQMVWNLWFGLSFLIMMVVPGHILNHKARNICSAN